MAEYDGAVRVNTAIDTAGFDRGGKELQQATARLQKKFQALGGQLEKSMTAYQKALTSGSEKDFERFISGMERARDAAADFQKQMTSFGRQKFKTEEYVELEKQISKASDALNRLYERRDKMEALGKSKGSDTYKALQYDIKNAEDELKRLEVQQESLSRSGGIFRGKRTTQFGVFSERISDWKNDILNEGFIQKSVFSFLSTSIEQAEAALDKFQAKADKMDTVGASDKAWASLGYDIGLAADEAERLQEELDAMSEIGVIDETQYDELSARIADLIGDYDDLQDAVSQSTQDAMPQYLEDWEQMPTLSGMVSEGFERIRNSALTALTAVQHPVQALDRGLALVAQTAIRAGDALLRMVRQAIINGLRLIGESAAEAARNITKMSATAVSGGIKRLGAWLSNAAKSMTLFGRSTKRNNDVLKKSLTTILKYGLGVRSFYFLFRKVRQAVAEGYKNLVRYSDTLNQSISNVISSFKRFENQFAASFEPLVNTIAPALTNLINSLTEGTYRVGEFIAALSGQKTVTRAKEVQEDYAASLDKTKKAAKEAERQLAGFDQLNILKKPKEDEETDPEDMFETVPVGDGAKNLADTVKDAWVNVDLTGLGEIVGGKIKVALDKIPWPDIKKGAKDLGKRLATFLNGIINVPDFGKSLGKALAEAINTAFAFLDGFAWNFDWKGLGNAIMDTIEAACDNLDWGLINHALQGLAIGLADLLNTIFSRKEVWEKIGETIAEGINAAVNFAITFLENFDFVQAAQAIVAALNKAVEKIEWDKIGRMLADALGGALQFIKTALLEFHWTDLGTSFAEGLNEFVRVMLDKILHFEWEQIGQGIADGVNAAVSGIGWNSFGTLVGRLIGGVLKIAASFIRGLDYEEIKKSIEEFFSSALRRIDYYDLLTVWGVAALIVALKTILAQHPVLTLLVGAILALGPKLGGVIHKMVQDIPWEEVGQTVSGALIGTLDRLSEAIESVNWKELGQAVGRFLGNIDWNGVVDSVFRLIKDLIAAGFEMLVGIITGMGADGIKNALLALAKVVGAYIAGQVLLTVLSKGVTALLSSLAFVALSGINTLGIKILSAVSTLPSLAGKALLSSITFLADGITEIFTLVSAGITNFEVAGSTLLTGAAATIATAALGVADAFLLAYDLHGLQEASATYGNAWETHNRETETALNSFAKLYKEKGADAAAEWAKAVYQIDTSGMELEEAQQALVGRIDELWKDAPENLAQGFWQGLKYYWHAGIGEYLSDFFHSFIDFFDGLFKMGSPSKVMEERGGFIASGLLNGISNAWHTITDFFGDALGALENVLGGAWETISGAASTAWNGISTTLSSITGDITSTVSGAWENVKNNTSGTLSEINKAASEKWNNLKTDASKAWNEVKISVGQTISSVKQDAVSKVTEIANETKSKWTRVRTDAVNEWNGLKSSVVSSALSVKSQVVSAFQSLQGTLSGVWAGIRSSASGAMSSVSGMVSSMASSISSRVSSIQSTVSNITSSASNALSKVADKMDDLTRKTAGSISVGGLASGGFVTDGGRMTWWDSVRKYASGTTRTAGSLFVAGEAGPEIVGHVNGRTEVLNQSQIAGAIYSAVLAAMGEAVKTFGSFLSQQMASNTNALIAAMGQIQAPEPITTPQDTATIERLAALQSVPYQVPAYATGTVMPYEVVAEIRRQTSEITSAIYSEGEDIIQAIVSAITNHGLAITNAIGRIPASQGQSYSQDDMAQYTINEINRRTRMNGRSPLQS